MATTVIKTALALVLLLATVVSYGKIISKTERFTTSDGASLHYFDAGPTAGTPVLVFIPGWTMAADIFEPQINDLQKLFRVIALDPRSQGDSEKMNDRNTLERRAQDIQDLIERLHLKDVVLIGWSNGVPDVLTYVEQHGTAQLRGIVLVDGFVKMDNDQVRSAMNVMLKRFQADRVKFTDSFVRSMYATKQKEDYIRHVKEQAMKTPTNTAVTDMYNVISKGDFLPALAKMDKPILYICEPQLEPQGKLLQAAAPATRVEVMQGAGHALFVDQPAKFDKLVADFVHGK